MKHLSCSKTGVWTLRLSIPDEARSFIGKREFKKSLGKINRSSAEAAAYAVLAEWKQQILEARSLSSTVDIELGKLSEDVKKQTLFSLKRELEIENPTQLVTQDRLLTKAVTTAKQVGYLDLSLSPAQAKKAIALSLGLWCFPEEHIEEYRASVLSDIKPRSQDEHISVLRNQFIAHFPCIDDSFNQIAVFNWWESYSTKEKKVSKSTLRKYLSHCNSYMKWLIRKGYTNKENFFSNIEGIKKRDLKKFKIDKRKPFTDKEILTLYNAVLKKGDKPLLELFSIACYTGCRIEEICNIENKDIHQYGERLYIQIPISKTIKGEDRCVPIHKKIESIFKNKEGYIIDINGTNQKYGERSSAVGKRFGRIKKSLCFPDNKVFHSTRRSFIDKLKTNGVDEKIAADIVGHEIHTMTYGIYGSGADISVLFPIVDAVSYTELDQLISNNLGIKS